MDSMRSGKFDHRNLQSGGSRSRRIEVPTFATLFVTVIGFGRALASDLVRTVPGSALPHLLEVRHLSEFGTSIHTLDRQAFGMDSQPLPCSFGRIDELHAEMVAEFPNAAV